MSHSSELATGQPPSAGHGILAQILGQSRMAPVLTPFGASSAAPAQPEDGPSRAEPTDESTVVQQLRQRIAKLVADNSKMSELLAKQAELLHGSGSRWGIAKLSAESVAVAQQALRLEVTGALRLVLDEVTSQRRDAEELATARTRLADLESQLDTERTRAAAAETSLQERTRNNASLKRTIETLRTELADARSNAAALPALREILGLRTLVLAQSGDAESKARVDSALDDLRRVIERIEAALPPTTT